MRYISKPTYKYDRELARTVVQDQIKRAAQQAYEANVKADVVINEIKDEIKTSEGYTIRQLKAIASKQKVKGYSNMTKAQLLQNVSL